jgi:hypothetical protein
MLKAYFLLKLLLLHGYPLISVLFRFIAAAGGMAQSV